MTPDQIGRIVNQALENWQGFPWWSYVLFALIAGISAFLGAYLAEKAKNLATKEDIGVITDKVESIRSTYASQLEELKGKNQLQLAALDKRLAAHQEAYALWRKLLSVVYDEKRVGSVVLECEKWWDHNCLYLSKETRQAFRMSYIAASQHSDYVKERVNSETIRQNWRDVTSVGELLVEAVALPALNETQTLEESQKVKSDHGP